MSVISDNQKNHIIASLNNSTLYIPKSGSGVKVDESFKNAVKNKTVECVLENIVGITLSGRNNSEKIPQPESVYKVTVELKAGEERTKIKMHLCDVLPLLNNGNKGKIAFSIYEVGKNEYLVPQAIERYSASQVAEFFSK